MLAYLIVAAGAWLGIQAGIENSALKADVAQATTVRSLADVSAGARTAYFLLLGGLAALALARYVSVRRGRGNIRAPLLMPAAAAAAAMGIALQIGYGNPL